MHPKLQNPYKFSNTRKSVVAQTSLQLYQVVIIIIVVVVNINIIVIEVINAYDVCHIYELNR